MRGTFITRLFEENINPITIMQLSGHTSLRMLERYAQPGLNLVVDIRGRQVKAEVVELPFYRRTRRS